MKLRLSENGYKLFNDEGTCLYTEEVGYSSIFQFAHNDLSVLNEKLESYIKGILDLDTMDIISESPDKELAGSICSDLKIVHPYFNICGNLVLAEVIADYLLQLIVYHTYDLTKHPLIECMFNKTYDLSWFDVRLKILCDHLFSSYSSYDSFADMVFKRYMDIVSWKVTIHKTKPMAFEKLLLNHSIINQSLYWILDISVSELSGLSIAERKALYDKLFPKAIDESDLEVNRLLSFTNPHSRELLSMEFMQSDGSYSPAAIELYDYASYENRLSADAKKLLKAQIKKIKGSSEQALYEEYEITDIYQILFLELEQMIKKGISIKKCRYCHRYFIADKKTEYCNLIAPGETETCKKIGPTRVYKANVEKDYPLKVYERAYGTRYAQYSRSSISEIEFDTWCREAKSKLDDVRAGTLAKDVFVQWINETKRLKKVKRKRI